MRRRQPRGFMTLVAVLLLGLVTAAVALLAAAGMADVRRTRAVTTDAQLRQLLLAGGADVAGRAGGWTDAPTAAWSLALPPGLSGFAVRSVPRAGPDGTVAIVVTADGQGRHASQRMTWARSANGWRLTDAVLDGR